MPLIDHELLIKPKPEQIIWRYMDLDKFESTLSQRSLFFCRSDKFSDPFEGTVPKREADHREKEEIHMAKFHRRTITIEEAKKKSENIGNLHKRFRRSFLVNCWHINKGESDAMWRLYLKTNEGVAIQSTAQSLNDALMGFEGEIMMSKVRYIDYDTDIWFDKDDYPFLGYNLLAPIVHKRTAFVHESELRVFQQIQDAVDNEAYWNDGENGRLIPCDLELLIEKVILPPTSDESLVAKVKSLLEKYGLKREIEKSKLIQEPYY